ncbi:uncharacterized protein F4812DRAFT_409819 [Daldinia caldariorum]|uniref:uncharacterized protein n=1 Tax=Daldinia caldariorum TaxID=326644 RepID=UPI00200769AC|nr:uncharacterized protein F4812DRAFT_409819 [Daldinia caldariorum]KAI1472663.1 hypothetical protein F4812DRAFT_409819 [Daldinia caldariorum]
MAILRLHLISITLINYTSSLRSTWSRLKGEVTRRTPPLRENSRNHHIDGDRHTCANLLLYIHAKLTQLASKC